MRYTQYLFAYGTLQDVEIQKAVLKRKLKGKGTVLKHYFISEKKIVGKYPVIEKSSNGTDYVAGTLYKVSYLELYQIDQYETYAYKRIRVKLKSGIKAWAYVENMD